MWHVCGPLHAPSCSDFDITMLLPPSSRPKIGRPEFVKVHYKIAQGDLVASIIRNVDAFYKPRILCRRLFTLKGVVKLYPTLEKAASTPSFLHKNKTRKSVTDPNFLNVKFQRSISLLNPDIAYSNLGYFPSKNIKFVCNEFLISERLAYSDCSSQLEHFSLTNRTISQNRINRLHLLENPLNINIKRHKTNSGKTNSRYSFPTYNSTHFESVS